jgi:hypothetical protein
MLEPEISITISTTIAITITINNLQHHHHQHRPYVFVQGTMVEPDNPTRILALIEYLFSNGNLWSASLLSLLYAFSSLASLFSSLFCNGNL